MANGAKAPDSQKLGQKGLFQLSLFHEHSQVEIYHPQRPREHFVACRNALLADESGAAAAGAAGYRAGIG